MNALVVCAAPVSGYETHVLGLAATVDLVIAADGGTRLCSAAGVTPDVVVGDLDSLDAETVATIRSKGIPVIEYAADKEDTDLDLALTEARRRGVGQVTVCAAFSGRLDHTLAAVGALARAADLRPRVSEPGQDGWLLDSHHRAELAIGPSGSTFSVVSLGEGAVVSVSGARWPLHYASLGALSSLGISNRVEGGESHVRVHEGAVLVMVSDSVPSSPSGHDET